MLAVKKQAKSAGKELKKPGFYPENGLVWGINILTNNNIYTYARCSLDTYLCKITYIIYLRNTWIISREKGEGGGESPPDKYPRHNTGIKTEREGVVALGKSFMREKKIDCGGYREVDVIPRTEKGDRAVKGKRGKRKKVTEPKQKDLNEKNAKRYLVQLGNGNFGIGDLHVSCTYDKDHLPGSIEEAEKIVNNYLRRIAYRRGKLGLDPLKYILVTEYKFDKAGQMIKRVHHHIIMNGGLSRDDVELMWTADRINWNKAQNDPQYRAGIKQMGWANADRIQTNENGIEALCKYIVKDPQGKKRWSSSRNLVRPVELPNADYKYTKKQIEKLAKSNDCGKEFFKKQFPDYEIVSVEPVYYEETGWHIYLKMWKKPDKKAGKKKSRKTGGKKK